MANYKRATISGTALIIADRATLSKTEAIRLLKKHGAGNNVYTDRKKASSLADTLSQGQGTWRDAAHIVGGYKHFHDSSRQYPGHIFYGDPS